MTSWNAIPDVVLVALLALGGYGLLATRAAVKSGAERVVEAVVRELHWPAELARELERTRGIERQGLRYKSYGLLWKELRPLAIYDANVIDKKAVAKLSGRLSDWYFSECGGLLLTPQARDFFFALQDFLQLVSGVAEDWSVHRSSRSQGEHHDIFRDVLNVHSSAAAAVTDYFQTDAFENWQERAPELGKIWREGINAVAEAWTELDDRQRFASLQQVGSKLRTSLVTDLESRLS